MTNEINPIVPVEDILRQDDQRYCLYPIQYPEIWDAYKKHQQIFWSAEEVDFSADKNDWERLTPDEKHFIENVLAFFAGSDGIVLENLVTNFCSEVTVPEARSFYAFQAMIENVHSEVYSLMIDTYITDHEKKQRLFRGIQEIPCVQKKADWSLRWISSERPFAVRLFAFAIVEGLFFSGSFCSIFWLKERGLLLNSLCKSNEWIARDEGLHTRFAILLYHHLRHQKLHPKEASEMMREAVEIETEFVTESLPVRMIGMNHELMTRYIRSVADYLLQEFGLPKMYHDKNPFPFMVQISLEGKSNFFETTVSEYTTVCKQTIDYNSCWDTETVF